VYEELRKMAAQRLAHEMPGQERELSDAAIILGVDEAVNFLAEHDPDAAQIVKLHFFAGLTLDETADAMAMSRATVYRQCDPLLRHTHQHRVSGLHGGSGRMRRAGG
jgi:hypothetical protein